MTPIKSNQLTTNFVIVIIILTFFSLSQKQQLKFYVDCPSSGQKTKRQKISGKWNIDGSIFHIFRRENQNCLTEIDE